MSLKSNLILWAVALVIALAIDLPIALNRTHHVSSKTGVHVFAAVITILLLTLVLRGIFFLVTLITRRSGGQATTSS
jgi:hypothetical protein